MKSYIVTGILLVLSFIANGQSDTPAYLWNYTSLTGKLSEKTRLSFSQKLHYSIDDDKINYKHTDIILYHDFSRNIALGVALRNASSFSNSSWVSETTPQAYMVYKGEVKKFKLNFSNRYDYRCFDTGERQSRYRNKLTIVSPVSIFDFGFRPYVAEEMFVKLNDEGFYNYRLFGGFSLFNIRFVKIDLFYCCNKLKQNNAWNHQNVGGLYLYFSI